MTNAIDAVIEILLWTGLGAGAFVAILALVVFLCDGTWVPARAFIDHEADGAVARWFDEDGEPNAAALNDAQRQEIGDRDAVDVFVRRGRANRMRLHRRSPAVRGLTLLAGILLGVGTAALVASGVLLFVPR